MAIDQQLTADVADFLFYEADLLDRRDWDDWLSLYEDDCLFWVPAWDDDTVLCKNPDNEVSLIYLDDKNRLKDRVWRVNSGLSSSLLRMPRMAHLVSNVRIIEASAERILVHAKFQANAYKLDEYRVDFFFGDYQYELLPKDDSFSIKSKKVIIRNDIIPRQLDFFSV